jgi:hypothetical protein
MKTLVWLTAKAVIYLLSEMAYAKPAEHVYRMLTELNDQLKDFERDHMTSPKDRAKYFGKAAKG